MIVVLSKREKLEMEAMFRRTIPEDARYGSTFVFRQARLPSGHQEAVWTASAALVSRAAIVSRFKAGGGAWHWVKHLSTTLSRGFRSGISDTHVLTRNFWLRSHCQLHRTGVPTFRNGRHCLVAAGQSAGTGRFEDGCSIPIWLHLRRVRHFKVWTLASSFNKFSDSHPAYYHKMRSSASLSGGHP